MLFLLYLGETALLHVLQGLAVLLLVMSLGSRHRILHLLLLMSLNLLGLETTVVEGVDSSIGSAGDASGVRSHSLRSLVDLAALAVIEVLQFIVYRHIHIRPGSFLGVDHSAVDP